jgi:hypothetical protein
VSVNDFLVKAQPFGFRERYMGIMYGEAAMFHNRLRAFLGLVLLAFLGSCTSGVDYSRSLFVHIPEDPEALVLIKPNDIARVAEVAFTDVDLGEFFGQKGLEIDLSDYNRYKQVFEDTMLALAIPWQDVESIGFMLVFEKPVFLVAGDFKQQQVDAKLAEIGFRQSSSTGFYDYLYNDYKLALPGDGLMMIADVELLDYLKSVPEKNRLWNREDFKTYRRNSPLDNSVFVWSVPPDNFMKDFPYRDEFGDLSVALDFSTTVNFKAVMRVKSPDKTVYLNDMLAGAVTFSRGIMGGDEVFSPILNNVKVSQNNREVTLAVTMSHAQVDAVRKRIINDIADPENATTFSDLRKMIEQFN